MTARRKRSPASRTGRHKGTRKMLAEVFHQRGYLREPDPDRRKQDGKAYKKGYEVRLGLSTRREVSEVRRLLREVGLRPGKDYKHHSDYVVPLYGREAVKWFQSLPKGAR